ncbi:ABC transporter permease protein [Acidisarcina polymorpha]|uniref:ABC transporter permease protein n=1 Tax=Acidisarcina polymorpha TaxID=2211140 RepID=A0A2Z5G0A7_9BACT|nr:ABC transporter permease [Acidisarcina polymorpha]AXC12016.1 ABC transporter permease protein [Acidisarcina polymorpha]
MKEFLEVAGDLIFFAVASLRSGLRPPYEWRQLAVQIAEIGWRSLPLVVASGFAIGVVTTLHTRSTLVQFGAEAMIPGLQSMSFFNELGPLVTGLLLAGRVGAGIGAELANMRVTEQIDAIETLSVDSVKFLVVPRIVACAMAMPLLTTFENAAGLAGGYVAEVFRSHISAKLYLSEAFKSVEMANFVPPTLKTTVFGLLIGIVSCFFGYTINEGSAGVRRAATTSVVVSSLLIILSDVILVKLIFFLFPEHAI